MVTACLFASYPAVDIDIVVSVNTWEVLGVASEVDT